MGSRMPCTSAVQKRVVFTTLCVVGWWPQCCCNRSSDTSYHTGRIRRGQRAQMWAGEYDGPHAALVKSVLSSGGEKTLAKATCEGLGGGATVIKKRTGCGCGGGAGGHAAEVSEAGFAALEGARSGATAAPRAQPCLEEAAECLGVCCTVWLMQRLCKALCRLAGL
jgi:hypothetical protein